MSASAHGGSNDVVPTISMPPMVPVAVPITYMPPRTAYPAPAFTTQPAITPSSGQVGTAFTAGGEVISNGTVTGRQWLLNGAPISGATSASYTPSSAGALACQVTATGAGGTTTTTTAAVTVSAAAGFTPSLDHSDARNSQYL